MLSSDTPLLQTSFATTNAVTIFMVLAVMIQSLSEFRGHLVQQSRNQKSNYLCVVRGQGKP